jgi:threonine synthase
LEWNVPLCGVLVGGEGVAVAEATAGVAEAAADETAVPTGDGTAVLAAWVTT